MTAFQTNASTSIPPNLAVANSSFSSSADPLPSSGFCHDSNSVREATPPAGNMSAAAAVAFLRHDYVSASHILNCLGSAAVANTGLRSMASGTQRSLWAPDSFCSTSNGNEYPPKQNFDFGYSGFYEQYLGNSASAQNSVPSQNSSGSYSSSFSNGSSSECPTTGLLRKDSEESNEHNENSARLSNYALLQMAAHNAVETGDSAKWTSEEGTHFANTNSVSPTPLVCLLSALSLMGPVIVERKKALC
ncbi:hypothetical protein Ciccas_002054 [Cichlidogyrus casuarinus]|uniref:Uncharacterized protein n=1 Tax=Cichlidogyrus casuarinus TaxID=1844966 RepID=A0ABD2QIW8_9PLAT